MDRVKAFQIGIIFVIAIIVARLFYWQFVARGALSANSSSQEIIIPASRGEILTSDHFPIVTNQEAFLIYAKPREVEDSTQIAQKLAPLLVLEKYATKEASLTENDQKQKEDDIKSKEKELIDKLINKNLLWVQLARKAAKDVRSNIQNLKGLGFENDKTRFYPEASMGAHFLGFVASNKFGDDTGYFGLEGYYDSQLKGQPGRLGLDKDPYGFPILVSKYRTINTKDGDSLTLTIDRTIQFIVEEKLRQAVEKYGAKGGTVIISDPKSGHILAMATYPSYQPSLFSEFDEKLYKNPAIADTYEPGSTFKLVTMAAALDTKSVEPTTRCDICSGPRRIGGFEISTWNKKYYQNSTMTEVIQHSDNIGMTFVSEKLGLDKFYEYIDKFGFGKKTEIDLQEETSGTVREKAQWREIDLATASFGQGLAVTPIQMIQAVQVIANQGKLVSPRIVDKVVQNGKEKEIKPAFFRQVITSKTAAQITEMMVNAVEYGEAKAFAPKDYRIAGKTGTAQIPVAGHYDPNKTIASFVGFAPANDPKFVMLVRFNEPTSSPFGSETAAPTFFAIAKDVFNYLAIRPQ